MQHRSDSTAVYARAAGLGVVAGMRSQLPLALMALAANRSQFAVGSGRPLGLLRSPGVQRLLGFSAIGELIGDKLPFTPSRLSPGPFVGRLLFGGLTGAAVAVDARRSAALGGVLGAIGATIGAVSGYHARATAGRATPVPDPAWGAVEDAIAVALGLGLLPRSGTTPKL